MPVLTTYVCDGCHREIVSGEEAFWIKLSPWPHAHPRNEHLLVHNDLCAARYFDPRPKHLRDSVEPADAVGPQ
jgi:hypothetical protein